MRLAILATRTATEADNYQVLKEIVAELAARQGKAWSEIHHGGEGAGRILAERLAAETGTPAVAHLPNWTEHGRAAGPIRGRELVTAADVVVALWDGHSKGTEHELKEARRQRKPVRVVWLT